MKGKKRLQSIGPETLATLLKKVDGELVKKNRRVRVTFLGGVAVILNGYLLRATLDFDIAPTDDAMEFKKTCEKLEIPVDIITVVSTVDLVHCDADKKFQGKNLTVLAVGAEDLIKLKLERFYKQDPEDIYAIIDSVALSYEHFCKIVREMAPLYIGNLRQVLLSAWQVVEVKYPEHSASFQAEFLR